MLLQSHIWITHYISHITADIAVHTWLPLFGPENVQTCLYWQHIVEMANFSCLAPILSLKVSTQGPKSDFLSRIQTLFTLIDTMHEKWDFDGVICRNIMTVPLVSGTFWAVEEKRKKVLSYFLLPTTLNGCFYTCARNCDQYLHPSICVHMLQVCNFHRLGGIM